MQKYLQKYFETQIFPILTPMTFDGSHPFPFISNLSINLAVVINHPTRGQVFSRVKVPKGPLPWFIRIGNDRMIPRKKLRIPLCRLGRPRRRKYPETLPWNGSQRHLHLPCNP